MNTRITNLPSSVYGMDGVAGGAAATMTPAFTGISVLPVPDRATEILASSTVTARYTLNGVAPVAASIGNIMLANTPTLFSIGAWNSIKFIHNGSDGAFYAEAVKTL